MQGLSHHKRPRPRVHGRRPFAARVAAGRGAEAWTRLASSAMPRRHDYALPFTAPAVKNGSDDRAMAMGRHAALPVAHANNAHAG